MKTLCIAILASLILASTTARADDPAPFAPETGFTVEARVPFGEGSGDIAPFFVGWRGDRIALLAGPALFVNGSSRGGLGWRELGVSLRGELTVGRFAARRVDAYVPVQGTVRSQGGFAFDNVFWAASTGLGGRYWVAPSFGIFGEGGIGVSNQANVLVATQGPGVAVTEDGRTTRLATMAALGLVFTF